MLVDVNKLLLADFGFFYSVKKQTSPKVFSLLLQDERQRGMVVPCPTMESVAPTTKKNEMEVKIVIKIIPTILKSFMISVEE